MAWTKTCDSILGHPKIQAAGSAGAVLHYMATVWATKHNTGGFIPRNMLRQIWNPPGERFNYTRTVDRLVQLRLFDAAPEGVDGWFIHDYFDYQLTPAQVTAGRKANAERQARFRERERAKQEAQQQALAAAAAGGPCPAAPRPRRQRGATAAKVIRQDADSVQSSCKERAIIVQSQTPQVHEKSTFTPECNAVSNAAPVPDPDLRAAQPAAAAAPAAAPHPEPAPAPLSAAAEKKEAAPATDPPAGSPDPQPEIPDWAASISDLAVRERLLAMHRKDVAWKATRQPAAEASAPPETAAAPPPQVTPPPPPAAGPRLSVGLFELPADLKTVMSPTAVREFIRGAGWSPLTPPQLTLYQRVRPTAAELMAQVARFRSDIAGGKRNNRGNMHLACQRVEEQRLAKPAPLDRAPPGFVAELDHIGQEFLGGPCKASVALRLHQAGVTLQDVRNVAEECRDWQELQFRVGAGDVGGGRAALKVDRKREGMGHLGNAEAILAALAPAITG